MTRCEAPTCGPEALQRILCRPIVDTARTRRWQQLLDRQVDRLLPQWDLVQGFVEKAADDLPHRTVPGYWGLPREQRSALTAPSAKAVYDKNAGRASTAMHGLAAFCYVHPWSTHRGRPELLGFFEAGLRFHAQSIDAGGRLNSCGLNGETWAQGWDVEGLIYGLILLGDAVDADLRRQAHEAFARAARALGDLPLAPGSMGTVGNQRMVYALGLWNYGQFLGMPELVAKSDRLLADALHLVLDDTGQVVEQQGPCMHYSFTAFFYAWLNVALRGGGEEQARVLRCLRWFTQRCTRSGRPFAGPTSRQYYEVMPPAVVDLLAAAQQAEPAEPGLLTWMEAAQAEAQRRLPPEQADVLGALGHGASPVMWAQIMADPGLQFAPQASPPAVEEPTGVRVYMTTRLLRRAPLQYVHVHRRYQAQVTLRDMLPFSGLQTFAWGDEPPVLHSTPMHPSTTRAMGLDTARQGVSHNWGLYGAGAMGIDGYLHWLKDQPSLAWMVMRYDWLWRVVAFTPRSLLMLEFGRGGPRTTTWTLDRHDPAEPSIEPAIVRFHGRQACLHTTVATLPQVCRAGEDDPWARDVRWLEYDCGSGTAAFAWSDASFGFDSDPQVQVDHLDFHEASDDGSVAHYRLTLDPRLSQGSPGNFRVDVWRLVRGTSLTRR